MSHQEPNQEFAPALQPDFTNQDHVFIVLEELGIAYMQNAWIERNSPDHADAKAVKAQSEEFREDVVSLLTGKADKSRFVDNGWAGAKLAAQGLRRRSRHGRNRRRRSDPPRRGDVPGGPRRPHGA